jgi:hypothetical protein
MRCALSTARNGCTRISDAAHASLRRRAMMKQSDLSEYVNSFTFCTREEKARLYALLSIVRNMFEDDDTDHMSRTIDHARRCVKEKATY